MHSDPILTERLRVAAAEHSLDERVMFGGVAFFLNRNFCCGIYHQFLILRIGEDRAIEAMFQKDVRPMDITGKPMRGWVMVGPEGCKTKRQLDTWVSETARFVQTLPKKKPTQRNKQQKKQVT